MVEKPCREQSIVIYDRSTLLNQKRTSVFSFLRISITAENGKGLGIFINGEDQRTANSDSKCPPKVS